MSNRHSSGGEDKRCTDALDANPSRSVQRFDGILAALQKEAVRRAREKREALGTKPEAHTTYRPPKVLMQNSNDALPSILPSNYVNPNAPSATTIDTIGSSDVPTANTAVEDDESVQVLICGSKSYGDMHELLLDPSVRNARGRGDSAHDDGRGFDPHITVQAVNIADDNPSAQPPTRQPKTSMFAYTPTEGITSSVTARHATTSSSVSTADHSFPQRQHIVMVWDVACEWPWRQRSGGASAWFNYNLTETSFVNWMQQQVNIRRPAPS